MEENKEIKIKNERCEIPRVIDAKAMQEISVPWDDEIVNETEK